MTNLDRILKSGDITYPTKVHIVKKPYFFSISHVGMWEFDHKEGWVLKNWYFLFVMPQQQQQTPESLLDCKEIKSLSPKGNQPWILIGRTDAEAETPILWPPNVKSWLTGKQADAGKNWSQEKGTTEDEMVRWHHWLDGQEFEQAPGASETQGSLVCCCL